MCDRNTGGSMVVRPRSSRPSYGSLLLIWLFYHKVISAQMRSAMASSNLRRADRDNTDLVEILVP
jgi:hypothetical protein